MTLKVPLVLSLMMLLAGLPLCARAQDAPIIQALKASSVSLRGDLINLKSSPNILRAIWQDQFARIYDERQILSKKAGNPPIDTTTVFSAFFESPKGLFVLSATATPEVDCQSFTGLGLSPNLLACPMRVALVSGGKITLIYEDSHFAFSTSVNDQGEFNNEDKANQTAIEFNFADKVIQTKLFFGTHKPEVNAEPSDDTTIKLTY